MSAGTIAIVALMLAGVALAAAYVFAPKGWRTVVFNAMAAVLLAAPELVDQLTGVDWASLLGDRYGPFVAAAFSLGNIVLRFSTTTAIGRKE